MFSSVLLTHFVNRALHLKKDYTYRNKPPAVPTKRFQRSTSQGKWNSSLINQSFGHSKIMAGDFIIHPDRLTSLDVLVKNIT